MRVTEWPRSRLIGTVVAAALIPLLQFLHLLRVLSERPPSWAAYSDPTYPYLLNGVLVVQGQAPGHTDHPGTSLQWMSGVVSGAVHRLNGESASLAQSVVTDPEFYLQSIGIALCATFCLSLAFLGYRTCSHLGPAPGVVVVLLVSASVGLSLPWIVIVTPESLVLSSALLLLALLLPSIAERAQQPTLTMQLLAGATIAVGMTAKIVFLPMLLLLPFIVRPRRLLVVGGAALAATAIILVPTYSQAGRMWSWFTGVASNPSRYGDDGTTQWTVGENVSRAFGELSAGMVVFWPILIASALALSFVLVRLGWSSSSRWLLPSLGLLASIAGTLGLAYKAFSLRDFILLAALLPMLAGVSLAAVQGALAAPPDGTTGRALNLVQAGAITIASCLAVVATLQSRSAMASDTQAIETEQAELAVMTSDAPAAWTATGYSVPTQANALAFGNWWSRNAFSPNLAAKSTKDLDYDMWERLLYGWGVDGQKVALDCNTVSQLIATDGLRLVVRTSYVPSLDGIDTGLIRLSNGATLVVEAPLPPQEGSALTEFVISGCEAS